MINKEPFVLQVTGNSMKPFVRSGDYILVNPCPLERLMPGDIVLAISLHNEESKGNASRFATLTTSRFCAHRLVWKTGSTLLLKGDSVSSFSRLQIGSRRGGTISSGKVVNIIRNQQVIPANNPWTNLLKLIISIGLIPWQILRGH